MRNPDFYESWMSYTAELLIDIEMCIDTWHEEAKYSIYQNLVIRERNIDSCSERRR
ncbi:hypothetical protein HDE74_004660 [Janthinobacterium sp. K2Li3]|nr:hypothetical protein [Janthinobacterium sp. K2C7]MBB5383885.1 hypothetical protein [Janthinobacterium sp. K2Li3]MBB5389293.1 hypothetical protein [Janthinobacterium sp. K2E3]